MIIDSMKSVDDEISMPTIRNTTEIDIFRILCVKIFQNLRQVLPRHVRIGIRVLETIRRIPLFVLLERYFLPIKSMSTITSEKDSRYMGFLHCLEQWN